MPFGNEGVQPGVALALSGGGYRATLFHVGSLWRLNELGYLAKLDRVSSVSGGSIAAGLVAARWNALTFQQDVCTNFDDQIVKPLRRFCERNIDVIVAAKGLILRGKNASDFLREVYEEHLLGTVTLQDLPDKPRFVFNATNIQTGDSFRFSKPYAGDYRLGLILNPLYRVSLAVAASSAFPPVLSPLVLDLPPNAFHPFKGADLNGNEAYCRTLYLSDGGVYDNLGLETVWKRYSTVLVSDAGAPLDVGDDAATLWHEQVLRALDVATNQSRALRKRALIDDFTRKERQGTYWGIMTDIGKYALPDVLPCDPARFRPLAKIRTRLNRFSEQEQCELINWGYALCDGAMRRWVLEGQDVQPRPAWPYPSYALG